jgi:RNA polymerase sigma-70 factor (ECF subfamily)
MQDTYMKAIDNLKSYKIGTNFYAWISIIARNTAINYYNKNKRIDIVEEYIAGENPNSDSLVSFALSVLNGLERDVVMYHIVLNMKFDDISKIIDKPLGTVYSIYKKAIQKIKNKI